MTNPTLSVTWMCEAVAGTPPALTPRTAFSRPLPLRPALALLSKAASCSQLWSFLQGGEGSRSAHLPGPLGGRWGGSGSKGQEVRPITGQAWDTLPLSQQR